MNGFAIAKEKNVLGHREISDGQVAYIYSSTAAAA